MTTLSEEALAAIEARAAAASPGPWSRIKSLGSRFWTLGTIRSHTAHPLPERNEDADWSFVEHARSDIPSLCQALRESRTALDASRKRTRELEERLLRLANEAHGFLSMADRETHGVANMNVLRLRIDEARAALARENT